MVERDVKQVSRATLSPEALSAIDQVLEAVERVLRAELADHHVLLADLEGKREAIRLANVSRINEITRREEEILRRMAERAAQRKQLGERVAKVARLEAAPLSVLVALSREEHAGHLRDLKSELEAAGKEIRRRSAIVRSAAEALSRHMAGVLQTVTGALSRAGVYGRRGTLQLGQAGASSVDVRS
jgi:hypothetical protein